MTTTDASPRPSRSQPNVMNVECQASDILICAIFQKNVDPSRDHQHLATIRASCPTLPETTQRLCRKTDSFSDSRKFYKFVVSIVGVVLMTELNGSDITMRFSRTTRAVAGSLDDPDKIFFNFGRNVMVAVLSGGSRSLLRFLGKKFEIMQTVSNILMRCDRHERRWIVLVI
jgi:hypothetical protein